MKYEDLNSVSQMQSPGTQQNNLELIHAYSQLLNLSLISRFFLGWASWCVCVPEGKEEDGAEDVLSGGFHITL